LVLAQTLAAQDRNAVCDVELKGMEYALHLVELGDNLFRIAQQYNSTIEHIWEANPSIVDNTIIPGQVIKVPRDSKAGVAAIPPGEMTPPSTSEAGRPALDPSQFVYHEVGQGQTLFSISRLYSVTIEELQEWNKLTGYDLSIGQVLIVSAHGELKVYDDEKAGVTSYQPSAAPIRRQVSVNNRQDVLYQRYVEDGRSGMMIRKERGAAEKLITSNPQMQDVYYALHKSAPVGSVMKVMNLVNRKYVFVTVLAPLPSITENDDVQIKLSPAATKELVMLDGKSLVELSYHITDSTSRQ
jgi:LysM repeat protein